MDVLNNDQQAILLLTANLGSSKSAAKPLTPTEWGRFYFWLNEQELRPGELLTGSLAEKLEGWDDKNIFAERIEVLLDQGLALALAVERWERAGIWMVDRMDVDYPQRLKEKLGKNAPAVLYGCGNKSLINHSGIAVVGSRNANDEDLKFASDLGSQTAFAGYSLVSGGARGIDESAMFGALDSEGTVVGVLACELIRNVASKKFREGIRDNNLVLITLVAPEVRFSIGNAMGRNKYIYCLSDVAVAVHSGKSGGTWSGAIENLKNAWVPLWVKQTFDAEAGNFELINRGGKAITTETPSDFIETLVLPAEREIGTANKELRQSELSGSEFDAIDEVGEKDVSAELYENFCQALFRSLGDRNGSSKEIAAMLDLTTSQLHRRWLSKAVKEYRVRKRMNPVRYEVVSSQEQPLEGENLYDCFLDRLLDVLEETPLTKAQLEEMFGLTTPQASIWLARAIEAKQITKLGRPVRYQKSLDCDSEHDTKSAIGSQRELF
ncbi:MAG: DNA processing protein DprA [Acidiferrobacteraceae bacterium]|nr:DNA processing protein DprA [Acidiferrobacteraceae bacterium]